MLQTAKELSLTKSISVLALNKLKNDDATYALAKGCGKAFKTVEKWMRLKDPILTSKAMVYLIKDITGLTEDQILVDGTEDSATELESVKKRRRKILEKDAAISKV